MTPEDRLRAAIHTRTSSVDPAPDALHNIEVRLMHTQRDATRSRVLLGIGAAAAVVALVVAGIVLSGGDDSRIDTTATTDGDATTSTVAETSSTTTPGHVDRAVPVFPDPTTSRRFDDPGAVADAFAREFLGFSDPVMGDFRAGDSRSGEVEVRSFSGGQPTTVLVRKLDDDTWFVLGATAASIQLDSPQAGATLHSPEPLRGMAHAFEGHVVVRLYVDGTTDPIAETFVMGRGDQMGDFTGELTFTPPPSATDGVLMLFEPSAKDGSTIAATVIRVHF